MSKWFLLNFSALCTVTQYLLTNILLLIFLILMNEVKEHFSDDFVKKNMEILRWKQKLMVVLSQLEKEREKIADLIWNLVCLLQHFFLPLLSHFATSSRKRLLIAKFHIFFSFYAIKRMPTRGGSFAMFFKNLDLTNS